MRALAGWLVFASACGRVGFGGVTDAVSAPPDRNGIADALSGHDEDGDGIDDAIDVCPHVADPGQADADGDGVGDACDPNPSTPGDHIAFFDPFTTVRPEWTFLPATQTSDGEHLIFDSRAAAFTLSLLALDVDKDVIQFGGRIGTAVAGATRHIDLQAQHSGPKVYYCELFDDLSTTSFGFKQSLDGTTYTAIDYDNSSTVRLEDQPLTFSFAQVPPNVTCRSNWPNARPTVGGAFPSNVPPKGFEIFFVGVAVELDYFVQIHTD